MIGCRCIGKFTMKYFLCICLLIVVVGLQTCWSFNSLKYLGMDYCLREKFCPEAWKKYPRGADEEDVDTFCGRLSMYIACSWKKGPWWCIKGLQFEYSALRVCFMSKEKPKSR
ncbi:uncharacterized protein LOC128249908 isoform X2 [Octopus bimaculoides]|uniref:uncharacterized protein LOC128249908 isoform X2 n=1 Tax=Octopus bimaculoides TaxID=37653 RepID=UPI0022DF5E91|nr:uncharacterized protein LOC128249908 isoform X2 [Octopus bimaculoides]